VEAAKSCNGRKLAEAIRRSQVTRGLAKAVFFWPVGNVTCSLGNFKQKTEVWLPCRYDLSFRSISTCAAAI
jgi:hypothetical protein